jgi:CheY-specific phosphatase CheX
MTNLQQTAPDTWLDAVIAATDETAEQFLDLGKIEVLARSDSLPEVATASLVSLTSDSTSVMVGVAASPEACQVISKSLLGMELDEEDLPLDDVIDALGEMANIVAGSVKQRIVDVGGESTVLGLPLVLQGKPLITNRHWVLSAECIIGPIRAHLLTICPK